MAATTVQHKVGKQEKEPQVKNEQFGTVPVAGTPAMISFEAGLTLNLGNYESAKVTVGLKLPCDPRDLDAAYEKGKQWVAHRLQSEVEDIRQKKSSIF